MNQKKYLSLLGYASGLAGADSNVANGPFIMQASSYLLQLAKEGARFKWQAILSSPSAHFDPSLRQDELISMICTELATHVSALIRQKQSFCVIGGDHTSAIGTWSGAYDALHAEGDIGLIWVDAHMDSHTPETTESGRIHGMPLASLLGYGFPTLSTVLHPVPKIKPEHVCLVGVRSFESGEAALLKRLKIKIFDMEEIKQKGMTAILQEAVDRVSCGTVGYGLSLDIDSIDPLDAPGVDVPEPDGIFAADLYEGLTRIAADPRLIGTEIVEFDPTQDRDQQTEKLIASFIALFLKHQSL